MPSYLSLWPEAGDGLVWEFKKPSFLVSKEGMLCGIIYSLELQADAVFPFIHLLVPPMSLSSINRLYLNP